MKIYLIRHGESIGNTKQGFIAGQSDPNGLTQKGVSQVIRAAYEIHNEKVDRLFASSVIRARETAEIISFYNGAQIEFLDFLKELNHGIFEGHYWWEVIHKIPVSWAARREDFATSYPAGESMSDLFKRVSLGFGGVLSELDPKGTYIFVSHQAVISCMRYFLTKSSYEATVKNQSEKDFLKYLHNVKLDNGGIVKYSSRGKMNFEEIELDASKQIKPDKNKVLFFARKFLNLSNNANISKIETASTNDVYEIKDYEKDFLLKIITDLKDEDFERQIKLYDFLSKNQIKAPECEVSERSNTFFKGKILVQDYKKGFVLNSIFDLPEDKISLVFEQIKAEINKVHNFDTNSVINFWQPPVDKEFIHWKNFMLYNINLSLHKIQEVVLDKDQIDKIYEDLSSLKDYVREERYRIVPIHGDLSTGNIIVSNTDNPELIRIVDFEWARLGDELWDYAYLWGFIERKSIKAAKIWFSVIEKKFKGQLEQLFWYRTLFHIWTVRDMLEFKDHDIRKARGVRSLEILKKYSKIFYQ